MATVITHQLDGISLTGIDATSWFLTFVDFCIADVLFCNSNFCSPSHFLFACKCGHVSPFSFSRGETFFSRRRATGADGSAVYRNRIKVVRGQKRFSLRPPGKQVALLF